MVDLDGFAGRGADGLEDFGAAALVVAQFGAQPLAAPVQRRPVLFQLAELRRRLGLENQRAKTPKMKQNQIKYKQEATSIELTVKDDKLFRDNHKKWASKG